LAIARGRAAASVAWALSLALAQRVIAASFIGLHHLKPRNGVRRPKAASRATPMTRVAHLTTVHRPDDPRILLKECATLRKAGYDIVLIGRGAPPSDIGVRFVSIGEARGRLHRMTGFAARMLWIARRQRATLYHFHDPELIPVGVVLKLAGARVVYDVHEDLPRQIAYKAYLPTLVRRPLAAAAGLLEAVASRLVDAVVAATPLIAARFPSAKTITVQNFPLTSEFDGLAEAHPYESRSETVAYVGRITPVVGGFVMADAAREIAEERASRFVIAGPVDPAIAAEMRARSAPAELEMPGWTDRAGVARILGDARVGLVLFQPMQNYVDAYPTKLFEYMAAGVPVVASDFPVWREIIDGAECGLLVDPRNPAAVARAVLQLLAEPDRAAAMGANGRRAVLDRYRWEPQGQRLLELYARLLANA
jgi:glycosyltransferase involved in cell wall biosynthesis